MVNEAPIAVKSKKRLAATPTMTPEEEAAWRQDHGDAPKESRERGSMSNPLDGLTITDVEAVPDTVAVHRSAFADAVVARLRESPTRRICISGAPNQAKRHTEQLKGWAKRNPAAAAGIKVGKRGASVYVWIEPAA